MSAIYLVRHGQASFGGEDYDQLSPLGDEQARELGLALAARGLKPARLVSGAMSRHRDTAAACIAALGARGELHIDTGWNEYDHLDLLARIDPRFATQSGIAAYALARRPGATPFAELFRGALTRWMAGAHDAEYLESFPAFAARIDDALDRLATSLAPGQPALVFTSGGVISVILRRLLGLDIAATLRINAGIANASVTKLLIGREGPKLASFNEHAHLERDSGRLLSHR